MHTINGGLAVDDRGVVRFVNEFDFKDVKRFYAVNNHNKGFVRAWHGHKNEAKYVTVLQGSAIVAGVLIDNWEHPAKDLKINKFLLSDKKPSVLYIPSGYANGFMTLEDNTQLIFFSTLNLEDSLGDDIRFDARHWDPWTIEER
jgi:dTDP-4-dehydrorhamnose 3,5-epimerase-like enzyme